MTKKETSSRQAADLRKQAEKITSETVGQSLENIDGQSPAEIRRTLHELRVHQVELDIQNEELRSAHAEISKSRTRYFDLYDLAPVGYVTISEKGFLLEANLTIATLLGEARSKLVKRLFFRFVLKEDRDIYFLHLKQIFETGEPQACELRMVQKDGAEFWASLEAIAAKDIDGTPTCRIAISDITKRKETEEKLRESEEKFRILFTTIEQGMALHKLITDANGKPVDFVYLDLNDNFTKMFGVTREVIGKRMKDVWPNIEQHFIDTFGKVALTGMSTTYENYFITTGRYYSTHVFCPKRNHFAVLITDITSRKQAEDALKKNEHRLHMIVEHVNDAFYIHDFEGNIIDLNDNACRMMGYTREEFLAPGGLFLIDAPMNSELTQDHLLRLMRDGFLVFDGKHKRKDGKMVDVTVSARIVSRDGKGIVQSFVSDITERKNAEAEKAALESQNQQLQKSESLGRMAAAIAHHFNNKLGAVIGNLELAQMEVKKGVQPQTYISAAMEASCMAAEMSRLMLTYLGQSFDKRESLDLSETCRSGLPLLQAVMPGNVLLNTDLPLPGPVIKASANQIQQVLTNLITNAREAVEETGGTISLLVKKVSAAEISAHNHFPVDWQSQDNAYACLEVTDTGCGIDSNDFEKLFDPFYSTKFTGRGLGLPVVLGIVKTHKGVITVESEPGRGSTLRVFFPVSGDEIIRQPDKIVNIQNPEEGGTVLLVEDEEMLRDMAADMLEMVGFSVLKAKDGIEALEVFGQNREKIRFVITDLSMPRMGGWETLTALRKLQPDIPVILSSGYDKARVMEGVHPELPQAFLAKPYNLKALRDAVRQATERRKGYEG